MTNLEAERMQATDRRRSRMGWVVVVDALRASGRSRACEGASATYPSQNDEKPPGARLPGSGPRPSSTLGGLRILVVEDDEDARELVVTVLEDAGAIVASASSAGAGFEALRTFRPQLLVSDIGMPDEDGYSLMRRVRALGAVEGGGIPSIALTAYTRAEDRAKALRAGFSLHMAKPIRPSDLVTAITALVEEPN